MTINAVISNTTAATFVNTTQLTKSGAGKLILTAANTATGVDDLFTGTTSTNGGYLWYHILTADGTATVKAQNASTNSDGSFSDITGATSGSVDASAAPKFGVAATAAGLTVTRYLRWQIALGTATTLSFVCGFVRG